MRAVSSPRRTPHPSRNHHRHRYVPPTASTPFSPASPPPDLCHRNARSPWRFSLRASGPLARWDGRLKSRSTIPSVPVPSCPSSPLPPPLPLPPAEFPPSPPASPGTVDAPSTLFQVLPALTCYLDCVLFDPEVAAQARGGRGGLRKGRGAKVAEDRDCAAIRSPSHMRSYCGNIKP